MDWFFSIHDDKFKLLDSVFKDMDLFFDVGVFKGKLSILGSYLLELWLKGLKLFLNEGLFFLIDEIKLEKIIFLFLWL